MEHGAEILHVGKQAAGSAKADAAQAPLPVPREGSLFTPPLAELSNLRTFGQRQEDGLRVAARTIISPLFYWWSKLAS